MFGKGRKLFCLLILVLAAMTLYAGGKEMKIIPLSSPIYDYVDALYQLEGLAAAEGARPWNIADLKQQMARVTPTSEAARNLAGIISEFISEETSDSTVAFDWNLAFPPAFAAHTNPEYNTQDDWENDVLNDKLMRFNAGMYVSDYFAADIGLSLGFANSVSSEALLFDDDTVNEKRNKRFEEDRFKETWATNIPYLSGGDLELDVTDNSYLSAGFEYLSLTIGRGQLSMGNGTMGNLILGNTLPYHDYLNLSASNNTWFDFDMYVSFFTHPMNYTISKDSEGKLTDYQFEDALNGIQMFIAHRFEFRMFSDKLRLSINEAIMYQSDTNYLDARIFNPLLIMHGYYMPANANSLASIELEFSPAKHLQLYASFALDDFSVFGEVKAPEDNATLNMWGVMGGLRGTLPLEKGYVSVNLEAVYTSPLMYHKGEGAKSGSSPAYSQDYLGSVRINGGKNIYRQYLSFPFGSDALAFQTSFKYTVPFKWEAGAELFFMAHGVTNKNSINSRYDENSTDEVPGFLMTENPFDENNKGSIEYTYRLGLNGKIYLVDNLSISTALDLIWITNFDNQKDVGKGDVQFTFAISYSIF